MRQNSDLSVAIGSTFIVLSLEDIALILGFEEVMTTNVTRRSKAGVALLLHIIQLCSRMVDTRLVTAIADLRLRVRSDSEFCSHATARSSPS